MFSPTTYVIRPAAPLDIATLERLAALDSAKPIATPALIGYLGDRPAAALSLVDDRVVADPFQPTANLAAHLRVRAAGLRAAERTPSVSRRLRAGLRIRRPAAASAS
jgi:hypothetical protein